MDSSLRFLRYRDLVNRGIVNNRVTLTNWIDKRGFPPGILLGPNTRAWVEAEVLAWIKLQPTDVKALGNRRGRNARPAAPAEASDTAGA